MLLQVVLQRLGYGTRYHTLHLGVTQFGFGLTLKLRLSDLNGDHGRKSLTEVVRIDIGVTLFVFQFSFLQHLAILGVFLHHTRQGCTETGYVGTTLDGVDIVDVGVYVLVEVGIVHDGYLYRRTVLIRTQVDHLRDKRRTVAVDVTHELLQALLRVELLTLAFGHLHAILERMLLHHALILEHDLNTSIQEGQLAHTVCQDLPLVGRHGEDGIVRPELHERTGLTLLPVADSLVLGDHMYRRERFTLLVVLSMDLAVAIHLDVHLGGECIHAAHTHTVQTAGHFVGVLIELTAGMQHGHHDLQGRLMLLRMHIHRDTTTVILHRDRIVLIDVNSYLRAETCQGLVDRVVHHLINQVVQALLRDVADVHRRTLTHRL